MLFHPDTGGVRGQMFLRRANKRVISKLAEVALAGIAGYKFPHCVGLRIFLFFNSVRILCMAGLLSSAWRVPGG